MMARKGDGQGHHADTADVHGNHEHDLAGRIPFPRQPHAEAYGTEGGHRFKKSIFKVEILRLHGEHAERRQEREHNSQGEYIGRLGEALRIHLLMEKHHLPPAPDPGPERQKKKAHGGGPDTAAGGNRRRPDKHKHHDEKDGGTHHGVDIKHRKSCQPGRHGHEKSALPLLQRAHVAHGFRIASLQKEIHHHPQRDENRLHGKDELAVERQPAPPVIS